MVELVCLSNNFDIFCISETFLKPNVNTSAVSIKGYNFFRNVRVGKDGGGVGAYISEKLHTSILLASDRIYSNKREFLCLKISCPTSKSSFLIIVVYLRPEVESPLSFLYDISDLVKNFSDVIIAGDLNIDMSVESPISRNLRLLASDMHLSLID